MEPNDGADSALGELRFRPNTISYNKFEVYLQLGTRIMFASVLIIFA